MYGEFRCVNTSEVVLIRLLCERIESVLSTARRPANAQ